MFTKHKKKSRSTEKTAWMIPLIFLCALCASTASAQLLVSTVAGGNIPNGIPAQDALLGAVSGIALDGLGNIVFSDTANNMIRRIRVDGGIETIAGNGVSGYGGDGGPAANAVLNQPAGLLYDSSGNLYFADTNNYRIRRIDTDGMISTLAGTGVQASSGSDDPAMNQLGISTSLAIDALGQLYFSETVLSTTTPVSAWGRIRRLTTDRGLSCSAA